MNIQDIAALVQIRNYAFSVREDRNIFRGATYAKVTEQINRIDKFLSTVLTEEDLVNMALVADPPKKAVSKKKAPSKKKEPVRKTMEVQKKEDDIKSETSEVSDSQIPLKFDEPKSEGKSEKDLSADEDADLIAAAIAKQKAKIADKKK